MIVGSCQQLFHTGDYCKKNHYCNCKQSAFTYLASSLEGMSLALEVGLGLDRCGLGLVTCGAQPPKQAETSA